MYMIKYKKLNRFLCLLVAAVVLLAMPLNTQAHAVGAAPWVMYAIITGLAAMGVTFTCAGGVDAMIDAMENKVAEYQTQTGIQLPIIIIENTSIQPPSEPPSGWNQNKGYFFLAYAGAMALTAFADWLISDGGWGEDIQISDNSYYFQLYSPIDGTVEYFEASKLLDSETDEYEINNLIYSDINMVGSMPRIAANDSDYSYWYIALGYSFYENQNYYMVYRNNTQYRQYILDEANIPFSVVYKGYVELNSGYRHIFDILSVSNGTVIHTIKDVTVDSPVLPYVETTTSVDIMTPAEFAELYPDVDQGILIDTGATAAETLEELGELFETVFTETGTIPQPQPQVITDPATQPVPTPVPTPNPSPEYEDVESLGLPALGDALMDKFPFCLPQDLGRLLNIFTAERQTPKWEVDLYEPLHGKIPMQGDTTLSIDFAEFEEIGQITRWVSVIGFCLFLLVVTKEFITW